MSWQEESKPLSSDEQIELIAKTVDTFIEEYNDQLKTNEQNRSEFIQAVNKATAEFQSLELTRAKEINWLNTQKDTIESLRINLEKIIEKREKKTVLVKNYMQLFFYALLAIILYQGLTTTLWHTLGFNALFKQLNQYPYAGLVVTLIYVLLNISALIWVVKKLYARW